MGQYRRMVAIYAWLRGMQPEFPETITIDYVLTVGAYAVDALDPYPEVTLAEIEDLYDEQIALSERHGRSAARVHYARVSTEISLGRRSQATRAYEAWGAEPIDHCQACVKSRHVSYWLFVGDDERALDAARPYLAGSLRCDNQPVGVLADVLAPLARRGAIGDARRHHERVHRALLGGARSLRSAAKAVAFATFAGSLIKARNLIERYLPFAVEHADRISRVQCYASVLGYLAATQQASSSSTLRLRIPGAAAIADPRGTYQLADLATWFRNEASRDAGELDARNGNDHYMQWITEADRPARIDPPGVDGDSRG